MPGGLLGASTPMCRFARSWSNSATPTRVTRCFQVTLLISGATLFAACSGSSGSTPTTVVHTVEHTVVETITAAPAPASPTVTTTKPTSLTGIGKKYTERGITAVVTAATLTRSIHLNGATKTAGRGAAFAVSR